MSSSYYLTCTASLWKIYSRPLCFNSSPICCLLWLDSMRFVKTALIGRLPRMKEIFSVVSEHQISHCQTKRRNRGLLCPRRWWPSSPPLLPRSCYRSWWWPSPPALPWWKNAASEVDGSEDLPCCCLSRRACLHILVICCIVGVLPVMESITISRSLMLELPGRGVYLHLVTFCPL